MLTLAVQGDAPVPRSIKPRKPRSYQREALDAYWACRDQHRGVLWKLFTSAGKTYLTGEIARKLLSEGKRTLFVCNRRVLGYQALDELAAGTGVTWELEQAENRADRRGKAPVVTLVQSMRGSRLEEWAPDAFDTIVADEVHRLMGPEYRKLFQYFEGAKLLGLTATADGASGYGDLFTHTAYERDMVWAIDNAWAVPYNFRYFTPENLDLDTVDWRRSREGGDFDLGMLDEAIAGIAAPIRKAALELAIGRTLIRCPGVKSVVATADALNEIVPGCARPLYGEMWDREKADNIRDHKAGRYQFLVSCMMIGEGYDDKEVRTLLNARPTSKRHDAVQWWGRGARILDGIGDIEDEQARHEAIRTSSKPECLVIELNAKCKHDLASPITIFGKDFNDAEKRLAKKKLTKEGGDPLQQLEAARRELEKRKARAAAAAAARVDLKATEPDEPPPKLTSAGEHAITGPQERIFRSLGIPYDETTTKAQANKIIGGEWAARKAGTQDCRSHISKPCTCRQCLVGYRHREFLARWVGVKRPWGLRLATYDRLIDAWKANGKRELTTDRIREVTGGK